MRNCHKILRFYAVSHILGSTQDFCTIKKPAGYLLSRRLCHMPISAYKNYENFNFQMLLLNSLKTEPQSLQAAPLFSRHFQP